MDTLDGADVCRGGQIVHHSVEQQLHALVFVGGAAQHGHELELQRAFAQGAANLVVADLATLQIALHQLIVHLDGGFDHLLAPLVRLRLQLGGDVAIFVLVALLVEPVDCLHADQVDDAHKVLFLSDGDLHGHGVGIQPFADAFHHPEKVRPDAIHLVDEGDTGHFVAVGLPPDGFGLGLYAAHRAEDGDSAVQHAH